MAHGKRHGRRRPARPPGSARQGRGDLGAGSPIIGYVARIGMEVLGIGQGCTVTGSAAAMQRCLSDSYPGDPRELTIEPTSLDHLLFGLRLGGVYDLDQTAYERLRPHLARLGMPLSPQPFQTGSARKQWVRVQWKVLGHAGGGSPGTSAAL